MKANSAVAGILRRHPLRCIIILSGIMMIVELLCSGVRTCPDTLEFVAASDNVLRDGVDLMRTPSYPLLIKLMQVLLGGYYGYGVVLMQVVVTLVSLKYLWCLCQRVTPRTGIVAAVVAVYGLIPFATEWSLYLQTESLSVSGIIFMLWALVKIYDCPRPRYTLGLSLLVMFLTFLRPALLYMLVAMAIVAILWLCQRRRRQALSLGVAVMLSLVSLYGYCKVFESKNGAFMLTAVSVINDEMILSREGLYRDLSFDDDKLNELLAEFPKGDNLDMSSHYGWAWRLRDSYPMSVHKRFLSEAKRQLGVRWYWHALMRAYRSSELRLLDECHIYNFKAVWSLVQTLIPVKLGDFYLILIIYAVLLVCMLVKHYKSHWLSWLMLLMCLGNIAVMSIGSFGEWMRLFMPSVPLVMLITAHILSALRLKALEIEP